MSSDEYIPVLFTFLKETLTFVFSFRETKYRKHKKTGLIFQSLKKINLTTKKLFYQNNKISFHYITGYVTVAFFVSLPEMKRKW